MVLRVLPSLLPHSCSHHRAFAYALPAAQMALLQDTPHGLFPRVCQDCSVVTFAGKTFLTKLCKIAAWPLPQPQALAISPVFIHDHLISSTWCFFILCLVHLLLEHELLESSAGFGLGSNPGRDWGLLHNRGSINIC